VLKDRQMLTPDGQPFSFEMLTTTKDQERLALAWQRTLARLGINLNARSVDNTQFQRRKGQFDYDVLFGRYYASLSPGAEQEFRWGSAARDIEGSFNFAGTAEPAIDAMIKAMLSARSREDFVSAVRAFDRVLISGHYLVPLYHLDEQWVAHWSRIQHPKKLPLYGYRLSTWWAKAK
jgi:peptide/nickel transport system substrate-binding protein